MSPRKLLYLSSREAFLSDESSEWKKATAGRLDPWKKQNTFGKWGKKQEFRIDMVQMGAVFGEKSK